MIRLTNPHSGTAQYVAPGNIARVTETGVSSQWHGVRSIVRTFDGAVLECSETAEWINQEMQKASTPGDAT